MYFGAGCVRRVIAKEARLQVEKFYSADELDTFTEVRWLWRALSPFVAPARCYPRESLHVYIRVPGVPICTCAHTH